MLMLMLIEMALIHCQSNMPYITFSLRENCCFCNFMSIFPHLLNIYFMKYEVEEEKTVWLIS